MPLWVAIGASSKTGDQTIDCLCAADVDSAMIKVSKLEHFVSEIYMVDKTKSRLSKYSIGACANWLKENGNAKLALNLLELNNFIPASINFGDARWLVPYFIAAGKNDRAWAAIQEAKTLGFANSMYCHESEQLHLLELEYRVLKNNGHIEQAAYAHAAERLVNAFLPKVPDKNDFIDLRPCLTAEFSGLDEQKLRRAAIEIYELCVSKDPATAISSARIIVESTFLD